MGRLFVVAIATVLTACQGYYQRHIHGNENSPYFYVPVDSTFELTRPITIPAQSKRIFFQNNELMSIREVNEYHPYCELQVSIARSTPQTVSPDEFVVFKVYQILKFQLAQEALQVAAMRDPDGVEDFQLVATVMELYSPRQPEVSRVVCAAWGLPQDMSFVTVAMIRGLLVEFFSLDLQLGDKPASGVRIPAERTRGDVFGY